jgi:hypothetical protein
LIARAAAARRRLPARQPRSRFDLQLGLLPGRHALRAEAWPSGGRGAQEFVVPEGDGAHVVDVALQGR